MTCGWPRAVAGVSIVVAAILGPGGCGPASPSGSLIVSMASGAVSGSRHLWQVGVDGTLDDLRPLTSGAWIDNAPAVSDDGRWLAWSRSSPVQAEQRWIVIRHLPSGAEARVPQESGESDVFPFWAPGGTSLGWTRYPALADGRSSAGLGRLVTAPVVAGVDGPVVGRAQRLSPEEGLTRNQGHWHPRGDEIVHQFEVPDVRHPWAIGAVSFVTGRERMVVPGRGLYQPRYSPEGLRLAWLEYHDDDLAWVMVGRTDGSTPTRVTCTGGGWTLSDWSPAGDRLVLTSQEDGRQIYVVPVPELGGACAEPVPLVKLPRAVGRVAWMRVP